MRLLHTTKLKVEEFMNAIPPYAILSHTWGEEEVTFQDMQRRLPLLPVRKKGFTKIKQSCQLAEKQQFDYIWIDTCCIDKSSSAELSEAINSMYRWYADARVCYAYLSDVLDPLVSNTGSSLEDQIRGSRWFKRGWTLQELIAPKTLNFYFANWAFLGERDAFSELLFEVTGVDKEVFGNARQLAHISGARKMFWASKRVTTRVEDRAYSLLGIFDVNMPLLYGEGEKAFLRLQEEILRQNADESLFVHRNNTNDWKIDSGSLLARSPDCFSESADIYFYTPDHRLVDRQQDLRTTPILITNQGIQITPIVIPCTGGTFDKHLPGMLAILDCRMRENVFQRPAILLRGNVDNYDDIRTERSDRCERWDSSLLYTVGGANGKEEIRGWGKGDRPGWFEGFELSVEWERATRRTLFVGRAEMSMRRPEEPRSSLWVEIIDYQISILNGWPLWDPNEKRLGSFTRGQLDGGVMFFHRTSGKAFAAVFILDILEPQAHAGCHYKTRCMLFEIPLDADMWLPRIVGAVLSAREEIYPYVSSEDASSTASLVMPELCVHAELGLKELLGRREFTLTIAIDKMDTMQLPKQRAQDRHEIMVYDRVGRSLGTVFAMKAPPHIEVSETR